MLSKDVDFNNLLNGIGKIEEHLSAKSQGNSFESLKKFDKLISKGTNLNEADLKEASTLLGYSDVSFFVNDLKENQKLGEKLMAKFPSLKNNSSQKLISEAVNQSFSNRNNNLSRFRVLGCNRKNLGICMAGAYGAYTVVITSSCPGSIVLGPWGLGACVIGVTIAYGAALHTCGESFGCNN